jgi:hypothetical protein
MKNTVLKYYIAAFYLCSTFVLFAQQPGDGSDGVGDAGLEGGADTDTTPGAPIDDYVWVLALVGLLFVFLKFRAVYNQGTRS